MIHGARLLCLAIAATFVACGGCGPEEETPRDAGHDMAADAGSDVDATDASMKEDTTPTPDAGADADDAAGDAGPTCGNTELDEGEACDGATFRDDATCASLGLPAGTLTCTPGCEVDTTGCAVCDDGVCSDGENAATCQQDCGVLAISAGRTHTCGVLADGSLWCWGAHEGHGMGGTPDTDVPVRVPGFDDVVDVAAGDHHTCFVTSADEVYCFGRSGFGESGASTDYEVFPPVKAADGVAVFAGGNHSCTIRADGHVLCWGRGDYGQRGDDRFSARRDMPFPVTGVSNATSMQLGGNFSCVTVGGSVACWGDNTQGQLGANNRAWTSVPVSVFGNYVFGAGAGVNHACFNHVNPAAPPQLSGLKCTGSNAYGQLGAPPSNDILAPVRVGPSMDNITGGYGFTCAVNRVDPDNPRLKCWGDNYFGQLGDGTTTSRHELGDVNGISDVVSLDAGYDHVCAILPDQTARCWGRNREGQLGNGSEERFQTTPVVPLRFGPAVDEGGMQ